MDAREYRLATFVDVATFQKVVPHFSYKDDKGRNIAPNFLAYDQDKKSPVLVRVNRQRNQAFSLAWYNGHNGSWLPSLLAAAGLGPTSPVRRG